MPAVQGTITYAAVGKKKKGKKNKHLVSLPFGRIQQYPEGALFSLHTPLHIEICLRYCCTATCTGILYVSIILYVYAIP